MIPWRSSPVARILWSTLLVVAAGMLAGCQEEVLKYCVAHVLFIASCGATSAVVKSNLAQGSASYYGTDLEEGLGPMLRWRPTQRYVVVFVIVALDASIVASGPSSAAPRLLLAGVFVLWLGRYISSTGLPICTTNLILGLSTATLQAMLWHVGRPVALLLHASELSRLRCTLAVTILPTIYLIDSDVMVILIGIVYEAPQWILFWKLTYSAWKDDNVDMLGKRGDKSDWTIAFVGPLLSTAVGIAVAFFLYYLEGQRRDMRNGTVPSSTASHHIGVAQPLGAVSIPGQDLQLQPLYERLEIVDAASPDNASVGDRPINAGEALNSAPSMSLGRATAAPSMDDTSIGEDVNATYDAGQGQFVTSRIIEVAEIDITERPRSIDPLQAHATVVDTRQPVTILVDHEPSLLEPDDKEEARRED